MSTWARVLSMLLIFGVLRFPLETRVAAEQRKARFHLVELGLDLRQRIGQTAFIAALSGFRGLVADMLWIQAHSAWERTEWERMNFLFNNVVTLQPHAVIFWDMAAWHMAWNASVAAFDDLKQPREALRLKAQREYFDIGRDFLERGIANNPDRYLLYERMAFLYRDKYKDHCAAAEYFAKAASLRNAPGYEKRMAVYELAKCPGHDREAYEKARRIHELGPVEHAPSLLKLLKDLEQKLDIPQEQRIYKSGD